MNISDAIYVAAVVAAALICAAARHATRQIDHQIVRAKEAVR